MKAYPHLFAKLFRQPLMLLEASRYGLETALLAHMGLTGGPAARAPGNVREDWLQFERDNRATMAALRMENVLQVAGPVAVVTINGVIDKNLSQADLDCYGGCDLTDIQNALAYVDGEETIERVVLHIVSPGGSVTGVPETAARVAALTAKKEVHAFVDALACSAGYYIASQADHIAVAPSATIGSIGVYLALLDETRSLEMQGLKVEVIQSGRLKTMGASFQPLTSEERAILQADVNQIHADFKAAVRAGRRGATEAGGHQTVPDSAMEGQAFSGTEALAQRLCDELTDATLDEYVSALLP